MERSTAAGVGVQPEEDLLALAARAGVALQRRRAADPRDGAGERVGEAARSALCARAHAGGLEHALDPGGRGRTRWRRAGAHGETERADLQSSLSCNL